MINVEARDHNSSGVADLEEAIELCKSQGISNAKGALHHDIIYDMFSLTSAIGFGMSDIIPGIYLAANLGGVGAYRVRLAEAPPLVSTILRDIESGVNKAAGDQLPDWHPTASPTGVRIAAMHRDSTFFGHTDDYEGIVASAQLGVDGKKMLRATINGEWEEHRIEQADITFFAGDTFSEHSRTEHGFRFEGAYAVAFTLGQDPFYTISGRYPFIEEHPEYGLVSPIA